VAYVGDADGNGSYSNNDAVLITTALIEMEGFAAYPLVDPVIVADTDGAGFIPADAALQANEAGVGFPAPNLPTPPIPTGVHFRAIANNVDSMLGIQGSGVGSQGSEGMLKMSVNIDDAHPAGSTGLIRGHLALTYDPSVFTVSTADVYLGTVLAAGSGWSVVPTIDPATGEIAIVLWSTTPIAAQTLANQVSPPREILARPTPRSPFARNDFEDLNWNDILDGLALEQATGVRARGRRRPSATNQATSATSPQANVDQSALDW